MYKCRHYGNGVGNKVYQLQSVVVQQAAEEIPCGDVEAVLDEGSEDDLLLDIFARELFRSSSPQLHLLLGSEQPTVHHA
jgi:hypothetical protein